MIRNPEQHDWAVVFEGEIGECRFGGLNYLTKYHDALLSVGHASGQTKRPRISVTCVKPFEIDLTHPVMITEGTAASLTVAGPSYARPLLMLSRS
jgi:hypothetical protein